MYNDSNGFVPAGAAKGPLQDVVPVSGNPAYLMVAMQGTQLTTSSGGHSTALTHQYENITPHGERDYEKVQLQ